MSSAPLDRDPSLVVGLSIGETASRSGVSASTLRSWDRERGVECEHLIADALQAVWSTYCWSRRPVTCRKVCRRRARGHPGRRPHAAAARRCGSARGTRTLRPSAASDWSERRFERGATTGLAHDGSGVGGLDAADCAGVCNPAGRMTSRCRVQSITRHVERPRSHNLRAIFGRDELSWRPRKDHKSMGPGPTDAFPPSAQAVSTPTAVISR